MSEYHKIQTVYLRDPATGHKRLMEGQWARPEFEYLADLPWVWTEKVDGTNIRLIWQGCAMAIGGKTDAAQIPATLFSAITEKRLDGRLAEVFPDTEGQVVLYGEGYGAKIQKGGGNYKPDGNDLVLFDVRVGSVWLRREDVADVAAKLGLRVVPVIGTGSLRTAINLAATGFCSQWGPFDAEGLVMRPQIELADRMGHRIIAKIKHKDFA